MKQTLGAGRCDAASRPPNLCMSLAHPQPESTGELSWCMMGGQGMVGGSSIKKDREESAQVTSRERGGR